MTQPHTSCPSCGRPFDVATTPQAFATDVVAFLHADPNPCSEVFGRVTGSDDLIRLGTRSEIDMQTVGTVNFEFQVPTDE